MDYEELIKNVKATLVKAAAEGKKKGVAAGLKKAEEIFNKKIDEFKESFLADLKGVLDEMESGEETASKENKK